jgi:hypothetical protein
MRGVTHGIKTNMSMLLLLFIFICIIIGDLIIKTMVGNSSIGSTPTQICACSKSRPVGSLVYVVVIFMFDDSS